MKMLRVDRGAIKFVLAGANIMCPGLTSSGGALDMDVPAEAPVVCLKLNRSNLRALALLFDEIFYTFYPA
jgi:PUA domain protein